MGESLAATVGGASVHLWPEKALSLPDEHTLLVADAHFGKAQAFRRLGVPVPEGTTQSNLQRLDAMLERSGARQVIFLGDLLHAPQSQDSVTIDALRVWRARHARVSMVLVRGNHDQRAGDPPAELGIEVVDEPWSLGPWALCHHPQVVEGRYALAGHVHPAVHVGRGRERLRLPCFHFGDQVGVLPAFGDFTGSHTMAPLPSDQVFVIAEDEVRAWPSQRTAAG